MWLRGMYGAHPVGLVSWRATLQVFYWSGGFWIGFSWVSPPTFLVCGGQFFLVFLGFSILARLELFSPFPGFPGTDCVRFSWSFPSFSALYGVGRFFLVVLFRFEVFSALSSWVGFPGCLVFGSGWFGSVWPFSFFLFFPVFQGLVLRDLGFLGFSFVSRLLTWLVTSTKRWGLASLVTQAKRQPTDRGRVEFRPLYTLVNVMLLLL
jgi:hypothetical protein